MKVRIISDGTPQGTTVLLPNGEEMPDVQSVIVHYSWDAGGIPKAHLELLFTDTNFVAEADCLVTVLPDGKRYRLVELD